MARKSKSGTKMSSWEEFLQPPSDATCCYCGSPIVGGKYAWRIGADGKKQYAHAGCTDKTRV